ncbi:MAG: hypothetical protein ACREDU_06810 [Methylocella sp.]
MKDITRRLALTLALGSAGFLAGCEDDIAKPYVEFVGGGFIFNYRTANHYYGFVVRQKKPLPDGAKLEAHFEVPGWPAEQVVEQPARSGQLQYVFQTGDLEGIVKGHPYKASLRILDGKTGAEIAKYETSFKTDVDQSALPKDPLVVGPGYQKPVPQ